MAEPLKNGSHSRPRVTSGPDEESAPAASLSALVRSQILFDRRCRFRTRDDAFHRIRSDFLELPGLRLTAPQAARLWGLAVDLASDLLEELVARNFLVRWGDQYCLR
jgi:hypothetical protein